MLKPLWLLVQLFVRRLSSLPLVRKLALRYPRLYRFLVGRFDTTTFIGLPLTLLLAVWLLNFVLLSEITEEVMESEPIVKIDQKVTQLLFDYRSEHMSRFFYLVTQLGSRAGFYTYGALLTLGLLWLRKVVPIVAFWLMMGGVGLSVIYGKKYIERERPVKVGYYSETNFSFPSGHATTTTAMYGFLAYMLLTHNRKKMLRRLLPASLLLVLVALVGFSRIYLGVHYLSDVLAGFLLGALWLLTGISVLEYLNYRTQSSAALHT